MENQTYQLQALLTQYFDFVFNKNLCRNKFKQYIMSLVIIIN